MPDKATQSRLFKYCALVRLSIISIAYVQLYAALIHMGCLNHDAY